MSLLRSKTWTGMCFSHKSTWLAVNLLLLLFGH